jgi:hypothetical protein
VTRYRTPARHEIALSGTAWYLWRDACLRSAGFPARRVLALCDDDLAGAADAYGRLPGARPAYEAAYRAAAARLPRVVADIAEDPLFREAVTWQNPDLVVNCLDKIRAEGPRNVKGRLRELAVTAYLQRYCLKNDTIGFVGPVAWASLTDQAEGLTIAPGSALLAERTTYFEAWAIDQVGRAIAGHEKVSGWLRPRRNPSVLLRGNRLHRPGQKPVLLSPRQLRMLMQCDGRRTLSELIAVAEPDALAVLAGLQDLGVLLIDLAVPIQARPEQWLRSEIELIGDPEARAAALRPLEEIVAARDAVAAAAGDPDKLQRALSTLADAFRRVAGTSATRRAGQRYAGRTLVYEDTVRDVDVRLGQMVTGVLARPLGLVLDSARWLVGEITERYRSLFLELFDRECRRSGNDRVPLSLLVSMAMPYFATPSKTMLTDIVAGALEEFQERWRNVLRMPGDRVARHAVSVADIAGTVAELFPARPAAWSLASQYSPDIMIAASPAALQRGEFLLVLGELHMAANTLESRCFVEQHPDRARLLEAVGADHGGRRVVTIPPRDASFVTSRLNPPTALLSPKYTYWTSGNDAVVPPTSATLLPAAGLLVTRGGDCLVVRCASSGAEFSFFEVIGDIMSGAVASAFRPLAAGPHQPRVTIDQLVLSREAWMFQIDEAPWAFVKDEAERYALARRWRTEHQLPERIFVKVPVEDTPMAADFRSLVLVNLLAKNVRRSKDAGFASFGVTETLPEMDGLWLADAAGERYTCELRMVASDHGA